MCINPAQPAYYLLGAPTPSAEMQADFDIDHGGWCSA